MQLESKFSKGKGLFALGVGIGGAWVFAILIVLIGNLLKLSMNQGLVVDLIIISNMISVAISLFAFSRYVVLRERLLEFIALAFLVGGFIRVAGVVVSGLGIIGSAQQAFFFELMAWQGGRFLFALILAVGTILEWVYPKPRSTLFDVFTGLIITGVVVAIVAIIWNDYSVGYEVTSGNIRPLTLMAAAFFLISFFGVSRNYLKYPTLFNYSISITLFLLTLASLVGSFSASITDAASVAHFGLAVTAYAIGGVGSLIDVGQIFNDYVRNSDSLKAANQELLKYQVYLEKVPDPIRIVSETGFTLYVNPAFEAVFGYTLGDMRIKSIDDLYEKAEREKAARYTELMDQGKTGEFELTVVSKESRKIATLLNSAPIIIDGVRLGTITVFRDITRRKSLEHHNQVLSAAVENTDEAIALTDAEGLVTFLNSAAERLFGYTIDDLPGRSLWSIVSPSFGYSKIREVYVQTIRNGSWRGEVLNRRKDGTEYYIALSTSSIKDANGSLIALVGICENITEKKWEEKRKETSYRVAQLVLSSASVSDLAESAMTVLSEVLGSPLTALYSHDDGSMTLELLAQRNALGRKQNIPQLQKLEPDPETNAARAARLCKMVFSRSLSETEFSDFEGEPFFRESMGLISLPLVSSGELVGVLQYVSMASPENIKYEADLAESAAIELAAGIQRLRLGGKVAEQADQLEKIFASAAEGIALVDRHGKLILMNEGGKKTFGIEEIPSTGFNDFAEKLGIFRLDGSPLSEGENPVRLAALDGREIRNCELMLQKDGRERILSVSASPLMDAEHVANGAMVIFSDITDQKNNEIAIKRQNRRLSVINRTALAVKDALDVFEILHKSLTRFLEFEGISAAAVYLLNESTGNLNLAASLGFSPAFARNQDIQSIQVSSDLFSSSMESGVPRIVAASEDLTPSAVFRALTGESVFSAAIIPILGTRKTHGILLAVSKEAIEFNESDTEFFAMISRVLGASVENAFLYSDVLEKSRELEDSNEQLRMSKIWVEEANAQLVQVNQQLEEASRLKSQFLANMSHELRTPLNSIIGFTNLVLTDDLAPPSGEQKEGLEIVLRNARNLLTLINDILDLSKIEAGKITISPEAFNIEAVVQDALTTVAPLIGEKPVELQKEFAAGLPEMNSDSARIKQIILNLLSNAAKFTDSGHIKVTVKLLEDNFLSLSVEDTGSGIPENYLDVIFEEFRQVDGSNTRKHGGTGLGLAISRKLSRMLGGDLTVKSEVGKGSVFTMTVPSVYRPSEKKKAPERADVPPSPHFSSEANNLVVCVDDDQDVLHLLKNHLESDGFDFVGVSDSRLALETAKKYMPVLITLDIMMPYKDGWEVLQELKADPVLKNIPVVIHSVVDNKALAVSLGAESYIVKPGEAEKIISVVRKFTGTAGGEVLVVDDNEDFTNFLRSLLEKSKFSISTARNGLEAIDFLRSRIPALIFLDLLMPEMDGFEVVEKMNQDERLKAVPVVVLTAKELTEEERRTLNSKIKNIVRKEGLTREIILREVNKFLKRK